MSNLPLHPVVAATRRFVEAEVLPVAAELEHADRYPHALVARMRELGLFGALVAPAYGGLGVDVTTYARVIEELCRGWMSLAGVINSHTMAALIVQGHGTEEQRQRLLPRFARGEARGGLCLTEPQAGSDVQAIATVARRVPGGYHLHGTKMFVTNGREGNTFALLALTDPGAQPRHRGMSCFIVEKGPGLQVVKSIAKLGYKGVDTAELLFEDFFVPAENLVGGTEGRGFQHVMSGLEAGRINIAARAVGVAQAAWEDAVRHAGAAGSAPVLARMATKVTAARLVTYWAAGMKDRGERCDLEAGMAKLYASEAAQEVAVDALRLAGAAGQLAGSAVGRHYRDTPLMIIGEGTNEIQRLVIARNLLERFGDRPGALVSRETESQERRQMVLAVRQLVEKEVVPVVQELDAAGRYPAAIVQTLAELGIFGALVPPESGGLGLDLPTFVLIVEELARGWTTLAAIATVHLTVARAIARFGTPAERRRLLPAMTRVECWGAIALGDPLTARREGDEWVLTGTLPLVEHATRASVFVVPAVLDAPRPACLVVPRPAPGLTVGPPAETLGARGLEACAVHLAGVRVPVSAALGAEHGREAECAAATGSTARLGTAATAVGLAQAAFEAALRYSQQRSTFGKPICQHQAVQLKLADMATALTAARLLTSYAAERAETGGDAEAPRLAAAYAAEVAQAVTLDAMRIHGGYGYTTEFPVERYYRDAARLRLPG